MAPLPHLPSEPDDDPGAYLGLPEEAAAVRARALGWTDVRVLPHGAVITMEYRVGRLNFEVRDGVVERCWKG